METTLTDDFTKPQIGPVKGIVTAEEARKKREEQDKGSFEDFKFISQVDDYRQSPMFKDLFYDQNFRNAILGANFIEYNKNLLDYLKQGGDQGPASEQSILNMVDSGQAKDVILSKSLGRTVPIDREDLKGNVMDIFPSYVDQEGDDDDTRINKRLKYLFNTPLDTAGEKNYAFTVLDKDLNPYVIPTFKDTKELLQLSDKDLEVKPTSMFAGIMDGSMRSPKEETQRYFKLLRNMGMDEIKTAEFMYAENNGLLEQYRVKHGVSDFLKLVPYVLKGVGEAVSDATVDVNNYFKDQVVDTAVGDYVAPKIDTTGDMFSKTKFAANLINEKTDGVVSVDSANALLAYSPDFVTTLRREGFIGLTAYAITGGLGLTMGSIKSGAFRNWAKKTFKADTFENALQNANKAGKTDADIFEDYWQEGNIGFLNSFRKRMTLFSMKMNQEAKGIFDPKSRDRVQFLKNKLDNANLKYMAMANKKQTSKSITQDALDKQAKIVRNIERNIEKENLKALIPSSFRSLFKDEAGVSLGIASMNHYYQMNSVDPQNMQPNFFLTLLGGLGGVYTTEIGLKSVNGLKNFLKDNFLYFFGRNYDNPKFTGKAKEIYKWMASADPRIQEEMTSAIESHGKIKGIMNSIAIDGKPIVSDPDSLDKTTYKLVGLITLRNMGDQTMDAIKHSDVRDFSDNFQQMLRNQSDKVRLYNEMAASIGDLRKARVHPTMQADEAAMETVTNYIAMYEDFGRHIQNFQSTINKFTTKMENNLDDMIDGLKPNANDFDPKVFHDFSKKIESLSDSYIQTDIMKGFEPVEAVKRANAKLDRFQRKVKENINAIDSVTTNMPIGNNALYQAFSLTKQKMKSTANAQFTYLKQTYGRASGNPVYMDATDFYGLIKNYNAPDFQDFFEEGELFIAEISRGAKKVADIKQGVLPNKFAFMFEDAAAKFFNPDNMKKLDPDLQEAITKAKEGNPNGSDFEIWRELDDAGYDVKLPIGFDDWKMIAQTMSSKAYQKMGTLQGKENTSLYEYWVDLAENTDTGFSTNFFNPNAKESFFESKQVMDDWKKAKGAWQDWASRYKHGYGKEWDKIQGKDPKGGVILSKSPSQWVQDIITRLGSKNLTAEQADELVSDLGQAFGGTNVTTGGLAKWSFGDEKTFELETVQKLVQKAGKQLILNSPAGKELLTSLTSKNILRPGDIPKLRAGDQFQIFLNNLDLLKTASGKQLVDRTQVEEALDVNQLLAYSDNYQKEAKRVARDIKTEKAIIEKGLNVQASTILGKLVSQKTDLMRIMTPKYIHDQVKLGKQGLNNLDETRTSYSKLVLDQLDVKQVADLNPNQAKNYDGIMREYDRGIAARLLEHVENTAKEVNNSTTPKVEISPLDGKIDITTDDLVKGDVMMEMLGSGSEWGREFRELVKRGSVDGTDQVVDDYLTIAAYMKGEMLSKIPFQVQGIPRSLSMSSWVSRAYAWQRGIIGTPFLGTEAAIHAIRKGNYGMFEEMMREPEIGRIVVKMLEDGEPPNFKDSQILESAFIRILARNEAQNNTVGNFIGDDPRAEDMNKFSKEIRKNKRRESIDKQMEKISKKTFVPSVEMDKAKKVIGETVDKFTPSFLQGDQ